MHMEMKDHLTTSSFDIKQQLVTWSRNSLLSSDFPGFQDHLQKDVLVRLRDVVETPDMFLRNHQQVNRGTRIDIFKHHEKFISVEEFSGLFASDDFTEETLFFHELPEANGARSGSEPKEFFHIPSNV